MKKVARRAGVSISTVSRVCSGQPKVRDEVSRKVRQVMEELGYTPNMIAKSLVSKSSSCICILLPRPAEQVFASLLFMELIRGIVAEAGRLGYDILISSGTDEQEELEAVSGLLKGHRADGVILLSASREGAVMNYLKNSGYPFVLVGHSDQEEGILSVDTNHRLAAYEATNHLIRAGHEVIGFVSGPPDSGASQSRLEGYRGALEDNGLVWHPEWIIDGEFLQGGAGRAMAFFMSLPARPTALVVQDDMVSYGVVCRLQQLNYKVPDDLAIVSLDNFQLSELSTPSISSVDHGNYNLGTMASRILIENIKHPEHARQNAGHRFIAAHQLIVRESSIVAMSVRMAKLTQAELRNQVVYSIYVRNHSEEGTFKAVEKDLERIKGLGVDIIWLLPVHPIGLTARKGGLGSPYANQNYREINPELGSLEDFRSLTEAIHRHGMKCIIDVVYNHTSPDSWLVEHHPEFFYRTPEGKLGNRVGDWGDIVDLDYNNKALWDYQIGS
ncbi:hypothetical protein KC345_g11048, partial [Hortaea werneckii]